MSSPPQNNSSTNQQQQQNAGSTNPDMRLLGTAVCHASSEDESFPATELNQSAGNAPHMAPRGWQSAKLGDFPQEIGLKFDSGGACFVNQIQILAHQSKTPTRVDIFVFPPPPKKNAANNNNTNHSEMLDPVDELLASGQPLPTYHDATFHRLGYVTFRNNEVTKYRTRERKSVQLNVKAIYVRLVLHKCYSNPVNLYSQVGIVALTAWGKPLVTNSFALTGMTPPPPLMNNNSRMNNTNNDSSVYGNNNTNSSTMNGGAPPPPLNSTRMNPNSTRNSKMNKTNNNNNSSNNNGASSSPQQALQSATAALQRSGNGPLAPVAPPPHHSRSMTRFSDWYSHTYNKLNDTKTRAVDSEDFVVAKTMKDRMTWLAAQAAEITLLDSQKCAHADNEDYNGAQQLHMKQMQKIDLVIQLCDAAAPSDGVAAIVAQMNAALENGAGANSPGSNNNRSYSPPGTPQQMMNKNQQPTTPLPQNGKGSNNTNAGRKQQKLQQLNRNNQQQHQNDIDNISHIQHSNNNNNYYHDVSNYGDGGQMTPENQKQDSRRKSSTSPSPPANTNSSYEQQQQMFQNMLSPPQVRPHEQTIVDEHGNTTTVSISEKQNESQQQQLLNGEDQPIRSKFAIEMAKQRMQEMGSGNSPANNNNNNNEQDSSSNNNNDAMGGTKAPSKNPKKKTTKKKKPASKKPSSKKSKKQNDDESETETNDDDEEEDETQTETSNQNDDDDSEETNQNKKTSPEKITNPNVTDLVDEDPNNVTNASLAPQVEGWEKDVMKLIEETASARFAATGGEDGGGAVSSSVPGKPEHPSSAMQQQQRAENAGAASAGLHFVLGKFAAGCLFSRRWVMRESCIYTVMKNLDIFAKHSKSSTDVVEALLVYLDTKGYGFLDHVPSIFGTCRDFLMKVLEGADDHDDGASSYSTVNINHLVPKITNLLPRLLLKACEGAGKIKDEAAALVLAIAKCPAIGPQGVLPYLSCKPVDADKKAVKTVMARHYSTRLTILQLIYNFAYEDVTEVCSEATGVRPIDDSASNGAPLYPTSSVAFDAVVGKFLIPCANHASSEVREPAVSLLAHILLHYLNEANNSGNATLKQKVLGTLRKLDNPVSKNNLVNLVNPPKTTSVGNSEAAVAAAAAESAPFTADHHHNQNNNHNNHHTGAKTAHPKPGVNHNNINKRGVSNNNGVAVRNGRTSTTPQPAHHHLNGGTPSHRGVSNVVGRRSNTPQSMMNNNNTKNTNSAAAAGGDGNTNNNALPSLVAETNPQFNVHGHSPVRQQQQGGGGARRPGVVATNKNNSSPATNRRNNNNALPKAGSGPTTTTGGRRAVGSVAAAKNHHQQQNNYGAHALGSIVGHAVN